MSEHVHSPPPFYLQEAWEGCLSGWSENEHGSFDNKSYWNIMKEEAGATYVWFEEYFKLKWQGSKYW